jgi:manganese/zinc/iron transport system permease protein
VSATLELVLVMAAVAGACALPGVFLVLRRVALVADAISHTLLFGIVVAYLLTHDLSSPWLILGATASGVLTVAAVEVLQRTKLVKEDAAIGLVFPALFAVGTIIASLYFRDTHLDVDAVLLGFAELAPFDRLAVGATDLGPRAVWVMTAVGVLNAGLILLAYKELKLATFDPGLATALGFAPALLHYGLMTVTSFTVVMAFDAVGPILVVALLIVPAASAYLLTDRLVWMLVLCLVIAVAAATGGTLLAVWLNTNVAGTVGTALGLLFAAVFVGSPKAGLVAAALRHYAQRRAFEETMIAVHLFQHAGTAAEADESRVEGLHHHLNWPKERTDAVAARAERHGLIVQHQDCWTLTPAGEMRARSVLNRS